MALPPITSLSTLPSPALTSILDLLFEPSEPLHTLFLPLLQSQPFPSYPSLISTIGAQLTALSTSNSPADISTLHSILASHPRLGAKKVDSAQSASEQAQLQGSRSEAEVLAGLNADYERTFPGLRYVVFVNGRGRDVVMEDMRRRMAEGDLKAEEGRAIQAMCDIAVDRAAKMGGT